MAFLFLLLIGIVFAWNVGYLDDMKAVFKSERNTEKQENQKEAITRTIDENNTVSTVEMNEAYIAEKIFEVNQSVTVSGGRLRRQTVMFQGSWILIYLL